MKTKIHLETINDVTAFIAVTNRVPEPVYITDGANCKVSAKSLLGALYSMEFSELWCECEKDIYHLIYPFVAE